MPNEFVCTGAAVAATGEPRQASDRAASEFELGGVLWVFVARPLAAATFKYVHSNSRVLQFEHGRPSSHLTRLLLH